MTRSVTQGIPTLEREERQASDYRAHAPRAVLGALRPLRSIQPRDRCAGSIAINSYPFSPGCRSRIAPASGVTR
ncbi:hypothetical protein B1F73_22350 [Pseudomonas syringae]|nr:hypothetical protein B1F77_10900 [Pseudomonas syringae]RXT95207.1 hypothetical protein B1F73_22350 [Pseudomonas syringae]